MQSNGNQGYDDHQNPSALTYFVWIMWNGSVDFPTKQTNFWYRIKIKWLYTLELFEICVSMQFCKIKKLKLTFYIDIYVVYIMNFLFDWCKSFLAHERGSQQIFIHEFATVNPMNVCTIQVGQRAMRSFFSRYPLYTVIIPLGKYFYSCSML